MHTATATSLTPGFTPMSSAAPVAISIKGVGKSFLVRRAFWDTVLHPFRRDWMRALGEVNLDIQRGEFFGLLGPNGAGKTTLFKILATLVTPDAGSATVCGYDVRADADQVREVL